MKQKTSGRKRDPERTKANILAVAKREFAERGLHGARVDAMAAKTRTSKRAIYYYFGGKSARGTAKDKLFTAVLEKAYTDLQAAEQRLDLEGIEPSEAIRRLVDFTFDYYDLDPHFVRLEVIENIFHGRHMRTSKAFKALTNTIIAKVAQVLNRGIAAGTFRAGVDPVLVHLIISSFSFFRASNFDTFGRSFECDLTSVAERLRLKRVLGDVVLSYIAAAPIVNQQVSNL